MIETERLLLRRPVPDDADVIARLFGDPEVMRYIGNGKTGTYDDAVERTAALRYAWEVDGFGTFIVVRRDTNAPIGRCGLLVWHNREWRIGTRAEFGERGEVELGWMLERRAWGEGFATEAATAARDWALTEVEPPRLISLIHPDNVRSQRVAAKIGEQYVQDVRHHHGHDVQLWALTSPG